MVTSFSMLCSSLFVNILNSVLPSILIGKLIGQFWYVVRSIFSKESASDVLTNSLILGIISIPILEDNLAAIVFIRLSLSLSEVTPILYILVSFNKGSK